MPTVGSLFAGVEGFGQGLEEAGFTILWQVEIDKDAVSVLERHYPNVRRYRDVREVKGSELEPVDVLVGGFPCQDLSVAGARKGLAGERSGLFFEVARIAAETATPWLLLENVPGLLSSFTPVESPPSGVAVGTEWTVEETSDLGVVLSTLGEHGYGFCTRTLDAQYLGVPQRRERVFIVGCLGDTGARAASVLLEPESVLRDLASCLEARQGSAGFPEDGAGSGGVAYTLRSNDNGTGASDNAWNTTYVPVSVPLTGELSHGATAQSAPSGLLVPSVAGGDTTRYGKGANTTVDDGALIVAASLTAGGHPNSNMPGRHREDDVNLVASFHEAQITSKANRTRVEPGRPADTLNGDARISVAFHATQSPVHGYVSPALSASAQIGDANLGVSHTLSTRSGATEDGTGRGTPLAASLSDNNWSVRRLMPVETERLMGWPDDWTRCRADGSEIPDGPRYRMIGNGVVKNVSAWIGRRLRAALEAS